VKHHTARKRAGWGKRPSLNTPGVKIVVLLLDRLSMVHWYEEQLDLAPCKITPTNDGGVSVELPPEMTPPRPAFYTAELQDIGRRLKAWRQWALIEGELTKLVTDWFLRNHDPEERQRICGNRVSSICKGRGKEKDGKPQRPCCYSCCYCENLIRKSVAGAVHGLLKWPCDFTIRQPRQAGRPSKHGAPRDFDGKFLKQCRKNQTAPFEGGRFPFRLP
jgi:hypothetical protein